MSFRHDEPITLDHDGCRPIDGYSCYVYTGSTQLSRIVISTEGITWWRGHVAEDSDEWRAHRAEILLLR